jgi:microcompartment protein CcmL/EutN
MTNEQSPEIREIQQSIDLSFQVEAFLLSPIGKYLIGRAEEEIESATEVLKRIDPEDPKSIRVQQQIIQVAESVQYWLADAIQAGHNAAEAAINKEL